MNGANRKFYAINFLILVWSIMYGLAAADSEFFTSRALSLSMVQEKYDDIMRNGYKLDNHFMLTVTERNAEQRNQDVGGVPLIFAQESLQNVTKNKLWNNFFSQESSVLASNQNGASSKRIDKLRKIQIDVSNQSGNDKKQIEDAVADSLRLDIGNLKWAGILIVGVLLLYFIFKGIQRGRN